MATKRITGLPNGGRGLVLEVTQEVINAAVARDSSHCVIADAIRLSIPLATRVSVDLQTIRFTVGDKRYAWLAPVPAQVCLVRFDQGIHPEPFTLKLGRPIQVTRSGTGNALAARRAEARAVADATGVKPPPEKVNRGARTVRVNGANDRPTIHGGKMPPTAALSDTRGRRRTFGLKTLRP